MDLRSLIQDVPDYPKPGILFRDITPMLQSSDGLRATIDALAEQARSWDAGVVAGIESRGFVFGTALACHLGLGFVPIRKEGKLPREVVRQEYDLEYGSDAVEVHTDAFTPGQRVLVVDDLLATGGTARAACDLVTSAGADVIGCLFVIELSFLEGRKKLGSPLASLITY